MFLVLKLACSSMRSFNQKDSFGYSFGLSIDSCVSKFFFCELDVVNIINITSVEEFFFM